MQNLPHADQISLQLADCKSFVPDTLRQSHTAISICTTRSVNRAAPNTPNALHKSWPRTRAKVSLWLPVAACHQSDKSCWFNAFMSRAGRLACLLREPSCCHVGTLRGVSQRQLLRRIVRAALCHTGAAHLPRPHSGFNRRATWAVGSSACLWRSAMTLRRC